MDETRKNGGVGTTVPKLSICISTYNRATFLGETLDSILCQMAPSVELLVVDGASPDDTQQVMATFLSRYPEIRYFREEQNSGVDRDYDKAVGYAKGEYCWLMTDDDLIKPGAIARVLSVLGGSFDLVIVNSEIRNADFSKVLEARFLAIAEDRVYAAEDCERFFSEVANYLSFIGGVVVRRISWLQRDRKSYYGTLFIHVGVIFQSPPIGKIMILAEPLIIIRYGNALWTSRGFEIWMFKWPQLIWSFGNFPDQAKAFVYPREPWRQFKKLVLYRAIGAYSLADYARFFAGRTDRGPRLLPLVVALVPAAFANSLGSAYCVLLNRNARVSLYDLSRGKNSTWISRWAARVSGM
jgi:glycosyltransferase involved in cell wall biosynthesis